MLAGCLVLAALAGGAQDTAAELYNFQHYGISGGLPESRVYAIDQDSSGYLWVGTLGGLARYNGREFTRFTSADGLAGNQITAIAPDDAGRVWVGTNQGLCRLVDGSIECPDAPGLKGRPVQALAADGDTLWVGTERGLLRLNASDSSIVGVRLDGVSVGCLELHDGSLWIGATSGLHRLTSGADTVERIDVGLAEEPRVTALLATGAHLWIGAEGGLYLRSPDGRFDSVIPDDSILTTTRVSGIVPGTDGSVLFGTYRGLFRVDPAGNGQIVELQGLDSKIVRSIYRDREGIVWVGLDSGMEKWAPGRFVGYDREVGLLADYVRTIEQDSAGRLWLGTRVGAQIVALRDGALALEDSLALTRDDGLVNDRIYAVAFPREDEALLATNRGVAHWHDGRGVIGTYTTDDGLPDNQVRSLLLDTQGRTWIGTSDGVAVTDQHPPRPRVREDLDGVYALRIEEDVAGRIWFATRDHGLMILEPDGRIIRVGAEDGFSDQTLWDLAPAAAGNGMWVGTNGDGLFRVRGDGSVAAHLTQRDGLANDFVWSVAVDGQDDVWAYTTRGLSRYDGAKFTTYDDSDGLRHLEGVATASLLDRDGRLWFASVDGLMRSHARDAFSNTVPPPTRIETAVVRGEPFSANDKLPPDHSEITFAFAALTFRSESSIRYRYRLVGLSSRWQELDGYRPVTYAHLRPGEYEFQVLGANADGTWSEEPARFAFSVAAPVWTQPWFVALAILALAGLVTFGVRMRIRGLRQHTTTLERLVTERTGALEQANLSLLQMATTDALTGLKNRHFLMEQIEHDIAYCLRQYRDKAPPDEAIAFVLVDLDGFKRVNDNHGHHAGDAVLRKVGEVLADQARQSDFVIRWGGDEFLVVARHAAPNAGPLLAERILGALRETSLDIDGQRVVDGCRASIGICTYPFALQSLDALSWEQVVEIADTAVYLSKGNGGDRWTSIESTAETRIDSARRFLGEIRSEPEAVEKTGQIRIAEGSG